MFLRESDYVANQTHMKHVNHETEILGHLLYSCAAVKNGSAQEGPHTALLMNKTCYLAGLLISHRDTSSELTLTFMTK